MQQLFKKTILQATLAAGAFIIAATSMSLSAHESCDIDLTAGISITPQNIEFFSADEEKKPPVSLYKIVADEQLIVADKTVNLTAEQQLLVHNYANSIRILVPQVKSLAIEGVDLAIEGVDLAFTKLLGEGNETGVQLSQELLLVREAIDSKLTIEKGITFGLSGNDNHEMVNELMGEDFEQRIESAIEKAVMNSMGSLLVALGQEMLFSSGGSDAFETRMENFGDEIASEMEARAEKISVKADRLCLEIQKIDQLEEQLKMNVVEIAAFDVLTTKVNLSHHDEEKKNSKSSM